MTNQPKPLICPVCEKYTGFERTGKSSIALGDYRCEDCRMTDQSLSETQRGTELPRASLATTHPTLWNILAELYFGEKNIPPYVILDKVQETTVDVSEHERIRGEESVKYLRLGRTEGKMSMSAEVERLKKELASKRTVTGGLLGKQLESFNAGVVEGERREKTRTNKIIDWRLTIYEDHKNTGSAYVLKELKKELGLGDEVKP